MISLYKRSSNFRDKCAVVTGGAGVLGAEFTRALLECGAHVAVLDLNAEKMDQFTEFGDRFLAVQTNVLEKSSVENAARLILDKFYRVDFLINGAGGNNPKASTSAESSFFDLPQDALKFVSDLNLLGTVLPSQVFGKIMAQQQAGSILNVSSMNAFRPLTRIPVYSAAKAAVSNFTQWLAVHMAQEYSPNIRVNAIAPGFFLTKQNRFLLTDEKTGEFTARGRKIIEHTPMGRFGDPADLLGAVLWLLSDDSKFVTGIVLPIDGGFSAYSGV
jgi:NAD(P)-dependent dehydrogenase (short-subunit alcohol dehydrogenase family)